MRFNAALMIFISVTLCATEGTKFSTASLVLSRESSTGYSGHVETERDGSRTITFRNVPLIFCIQQAYGVKEYQVVGPGWIKSTRYDISASLAPGSTTDQVWQALRVLLAERLRVAVRREEKELPIYALTVGKDGPKLHVATGVGAAGSGFQPVGGRNLMQGGSGSLRFDHISMEEFCGHLSRNTKRPVVDETEISGSFDIDLRYGQGGIEGALRRQLGLKLVARKGPVELVVVENAVRKPI